MKRALFIALGAMIALQPVRASAQIVFNGTPNDVEWLNFISGSDEYGTWGVQVGPYSGQFLADDEVARMVTTSPFSLYCVDYYHYASYSNGLVNVTGLGDGPGSFDVLNKTRLGDYGRYQQSAYLASLFDSWTVHQTALNSMYGSGQFSMAEVWGGLHAAIWKIATGPDDLGSGDAALARDYFFSLAGTNGRGFSTEDWYLVTRTTVIQGEGYENGQVKYNDTGQEFLMRVASVPEPGTLLLMVTGLFLLVGVHRKRLIEGFDEA